MLYRGPYEQGGSYFAFNTCTSQASCWVAASLYVAHFTGVKKLDESTIYVFIAALQTLWALTVCAFFMNIKREYWRSFFSTESGRQNAKAYFLDNDVDVAKMLIFKRHTDLWSEILEDVRSYTFANWERWEREKPQWFDENFKANVNDSFIPKKVLDELKRKSVGGKRRRSTYFQAN
jgi:hypothetical protein